MDKQQLEERIQATATEIFSLEEIARCDENEEFKSLKTKLAADIWRWCTLVFGSQRTGNAGVEIMECINRSLSSFKGELAEYMKYIAAALKKEIGWAAGEAADEERWLISLPDKKQRELKRFLRSAGHYGKDITNADVQKLIAKECGCDVEEIAELAQYYVQSFVRGDTIISGDGEEQSRWETVPAQEAMTEEAFIQKIGLELCIAEIDKTFASAQERTKPYLSALITHRLLVELEDAKTDNAVALLRSASFAKTECAQKLIAMYQEDGELCLQEEVAKWFDRDKTDASRTLKKFLEKVSTRMKNDYNNR